MTNLPEMPDYFVKSVGRIIENDVGSKEGHASMSIAVSAAFISDALSISETKDLRVRARPVAQG